MIDETEIYEHEPTEEAGPPPATIAVLRLGTLGDAMLTTPLYDALKRLYPEARLSVIASAWNAVIPQNHPAVDEVISIPSGVRSLTRWLRTLAGRRFDMYIDPKDHRSTTSRLVAEFVRARKKFMAVDNVPMFSGAEIVPPASGEHFVDSALAPLMFSATETPFARRPSISVPDQAAENVREEMGEEGRPYVVVNISTGSPTRRWPEEKWREFIERLQWHDEILVISSPADAASAKHVAAVRLEARYFPTGSLMEAAALVRGAHALVTSDTSIVHIASAFNTPILALYFHAPRMMKKFAPLSDVQHVLVAPDEQSVAVIEVEKVVEEAERMLGEL